MMSKKKRTYDLINELFSIIKKGYIALPEKTFYNNGWNEKGEKMTTTEKILEKTKRKFTRQDLMSVLGFSSAFSLHKRCVKNRFTTTELYSINKLLGIEFDIKSEVPICIQIRNQKQEFLLKDICQALKIGRYALKNKMDKNSFTSEDIEALKSIGIV